MVSINIGTQSSKQLDIEKKKIESRITPKFEKIFDNLATDAKNLYIATETLNSPLIASNYSPEFLKEIRDTMRKSIRYFGFEIRRDIEMKHNLFFDSENKALFIELELKKSIKIVDEDLEPKLDTINNNFLLQSSLFIANESENQNNYITQTNQNMINDALIKADVDYQQYIEDNQTLIFTLQEKLPNVSVEQRTKITRQIENIRNQILISTDNKKKIIGENIRINILAKAPARSELIAEQNVGLAESWSRQTEAELIHTAGLITDENEEIYITKTWDSILDGSTRVGQFNHVIPDGQTVEVDQDYTVSGEKLKYPRDGSRASTGNIIRCRCNSRFTTQTRAIEQ